MFISLLFPAQTSVYNHQYKCNLMYHTKVIPKKVNNYSVFYLFTYDHWSHVEDKFDAARTS